MLFRRPAVDLPQNSRIQRAGRKISERLVESRSLLCFALLSADTGAGGGSKCVDDIIWWLLIPLCVLCFFFLCNFYLSVHEICLRSSWLPLSCFCLSVDLVDWCSSDLILSICRSSLLYRCNSDMIQVLVVFWSAVCVFVFSEI